MAKYIIDIASPNVRNEYIVYWTYDGLEAKRVSDLTPYTEPDFDAIRKEAYEQGRKDGYSKHDTEKIRKRGYDKGLDDIGNALRLLLFQYSNYTLQEIFGYDTARAVVEHFEGSEIVARIRCYEGDVKQDVETIRKEAYDAAYADAEEIYEKGNRVMYQKGLKDAWEAVNKILELNTNARIKIFSCASFRNTIAMFSASEAIERLQAYEQEKEEQIQVGDEVTPRETEYDDMIVTRLWKDDYNFDYIDAIGFDGRIGSFLVSRVSKTGKHYETAEVLAKMKEGRDG